MFEVIFCIIYFQCDPRFNAEQGKKCIKNYFKKDKDCLLLL